MSFGRMLTVNGKRFLVLALLPVIFFNGLNGMYVHAHMRAHVYMDIFFVVLTYSLKMISFSEFCDDLGYDETRADRP